MLGKPDIRSPKKHRKEIRKEMMGRARGDRKREAILEVLKNSPNGLRAPDVARMSGVHEAKLAYYHLKILIQAGLVVREDRPTAKGQWTYYRLTTEEERGERPIPKVSVSTGHKCFQGKHAKSASDEARFRVRPACACHVTINTCRIHLGKAVMEIAPDCIHMRFGEVVVRPLLPR